MLFKRCLIILLLNYSASLADHYTIPDADFMESIADVNRIAKNIISLNMKSVDFFAKHYEAKKPSKMQYQEKPLIPKIMHHIWLGLSDIPPLYQHYLNECKKLHPDWEFKIWYEKDIDELGLQNKDIYDKARSYVGRSDIARYEILYRFGGVYRDMDVKCFRPIDDLNHKYDFFIPVEPPAKEWADSHLWTKTFSEMIAANNGIIGTKPYHPILETTLDIIRNHFDDLLDKHDKTPYEHVHTLAVKSTLTPLTEAFMHNAELKDKSIALPPTYFFSLLNRTFKDPDAENQGLKSKIKRLINEPLKPILFFVRPESLMFHNIRPDKREIFYCHFDYGNKLGSKDIKNLFNELPITQRKIVSTFEMVYEDYAGPGKISLNQKSKTPQVINFVVFDDQELAVLENNLDKWKVLNGDFEIKIWDKEKINKHFEDVKLAHISEKARFYLGLRILEKFGGTYVSYKAIPHQPIFQLNNLYSFYVGLMPLVNRGQELSLSRKIIGSKPGHPIISRTLKQIDLNDIISLGKLDNILLDETHKGIYLNGKNIVFPAIYFEPVAKIYDETYKEKFRRLKKNLPQPFSNYTEFTIVE